MTLLLVILPIRGVSDLFYFSHLDPSQGHVYAIMQDKKGFIWLGTRDGLNRFDGYDLKIYRNNRHEAHSISSHYVYSLLEDGEGQLWIGTRSGLNRFDPNRNSFERFQHKADDPHSLSHNTVLAIARGNDGQGNFLWVGTGRGLNRFDPITGSCIRFIHDPRDEHSLGGNDIRALSQKDATLYIAGRGLGLNSMDVNQPGIFRRYQHQHDNPASLSSNHVTALFHDRAGRLWIGSLGGLDLLESDGRIVRIPDQNGRAFPHVTSIAADRNGKIMFTTMGSGLFRLDPETFETKQWLRNSDQRNHPSGNANVVFVDRGGITWVGSYGDGISIMKPTAFRTWTSGRKVTAVYRDKLENLWIGYAHGAVETVNGDGLSTVRLAESGNQSHGDSVLSFLQDRKGDLWMGSLSGLHRYNPIAGSFQMQQQQQSESFSEGGYLVSCLLEDNSQRLWVGTYWGLERRGVNDRLVEEIYKHNPRKSESISDDRILCLYADPVRKAIIWIGTRNGGLNKMDLHRPGLFSRFVSKPDDPRSIGDNSVTSIFRNAEDFLWVATSGGLDKFYPDQGVLRSYTIVDGLPSNTIYSIREDDKGGLWLSTSKGLSRFDYRTEHFSGYDVRDGLEVENFHEGCSTSDNNGTLFFGGNNGLIGFKPRDLQKERFLPIVFTNLMLDNEPVLSGGTDSISTSIEEASDLHLTYRNQSFELFFSALDFESPQTIRYQHKLDGFDPYWIETNAENRRVVYTNLDPDSYRFRIKAADRTGRWSHERELYVHVSPPPWKAWYAYLLYALLIGGIGYAYIHTQNLIRQALENKIHERTVRLVAAQRQFIENAHQAGMAETAGNVLHSVGNALNSLQTSLQVIRDAGREDKWLNLLGRILTGLENREINSEKTDTRILAALGEINKNLIRRDRIIREESERLENHALLMSRVLREQHELTHSDAEIMRDYPIDELIEEILMMRYWLSTEKNIIMTSDVAPTKGLMLKVVKTKLTRVLFFILKNAWEAIEEAGIDTGEIIFKSRLRDEKLIITVIDNGNGINPEHATRIFTHDFTTKEKLRGFGLHYCANAVKEMSGTISLHSEGPNLGARVSLEFPIINPKISGSPDE